MKIGKYDITPKNMLSFIRGNTTMFLDAMDIVNLSNFERTQLFFRLSLCKPCTEGKECVVCNCATPNLFYDKNREDSLTRWGKMMPDHIFAQFMLDNNVVIIDDNEVDLSTKTDDELLSIITNYSIWYQNSSNYQFDEYVINKRNTYLIDNDIFKMTSENVFTDPEPEEEYVTEFYQAGNLIKFPAVNIVKKSKKNPTDTIDTSQNLSIEEILLKENKIASLSSTYTISPEVVNTSNNTTITSNNFNIVDNIVYDFNTCSKSDDLTYTFVYKNTTQIPLTIKAIGSSCGCTSASSTSQLNKDVIKPNEELKITLTYVDKRQGEFTKQAYVYYNEVPNITTLTIKGNIL
jgi:hypothetical protein